jgi:glycosyltransferase 2 family protein
VRRGTIIALTIGAAAVAAAVFHAGAGTVAQALESIHISGLGVLALLHLPIVALMGLAWRLASGDDPPASPSRYFWARLVRDAAGELLPFVQLGGLVFGLRALGRGAVIARGAVSACIDGVVELTAKLPYVLAALITLLAFGRSHFAGLLSAALAATGLVVASLALARRSLGSWLGAMARAVASRWPAVLPQVDGDAGREVEACFDRILRRPARLWSGFALHLGCWCLGAGEAWLIFRLLGVDLTLPQALAIDGTVAGLRTFGFMIPAAAGIQEASFMLAAAVFGISPAAAIAASLVRRARDLALGIGTLGVAAVGDVRSWCTIPPHQ